MAMSRYEGYLAAVNAGARWADMDDAREYEVVCDLHKLQTVAALRVPGWTPEIREELRRRSREWKEFHPF